MGWTTPTCTLSPNNELPNMHPGKQIVVLSKSSEHSWPLTNLSRYSCSITCPLCFQDVHLDLNYECTCVCTCELFISPSMQAHLWAQHWQRSYFLLSPWPGTQKVLKGHLLNNQVKDRGCPGTAPPPQFLEEGAQGAATLWAELWEKGMLAVQSKAGQNSPAQRTASLHKPCMSTWDSFSPTRRF